MRPIQSYLVKYPVLWALYLFPLAIVFPVSLKAIPYLTLIVAAIFLLGKDHEARKIYGRIKPIALAFGLYLPYSLAAIWLQNSPLKAGDNGLHFLYFLCIAVCFCELRSQRMFWYGISTAAFAAGMFAMYQRFGLGIGRPYGMYGINEIGLSGAIKFGMVTVVFSLLSLVAALDDRTSIQVRLAHICASLVGFSGSLMIGSRGPCVALIVIGVGLIIGRALQQYGRIRWLTVFLAFLSAVLIVALFHAQIYASVSRTMTELAAVYNGNFNTSFGHRIALWKTAVTMFIANPFFGVGINQFGAHLQQMIASGQAPQVLANYTHTHNEYLQALATGGMIGLAYLLWLFGAPLIFFARRVMHQRKDGADAIAPLGGLITVLAFAIFSISDNIFDRQMTTSLFAFLTLGFAVMTTNNAAKH